jgi:hypothetical protein
MRDHNTSQPSSQAHSRSASDSASGSQMLGAPSVQTENSKTGKAQISDYATFVSNHVFQVCVERLSNLKSEMHLSEGSLNESLKSQGQIPNKSRKSLQSLGDLYNVVAYDEDLVLPDAYYNSGACLVIKIPGLSSLVQSLSKANVPADAVVKAFEPYYTNVYL